jgi:hypothetical protein
MASKEFEEKKKLISLEKELEIFKHKIVMEELQFRRESDKLHHERELERNRIKSAEIKRTIALKDMGRNRYG